MMGTCQDREPLEGFLTSQVCSIYYQNGAHNITHWESLISIDKKNGEKGKCQSRISANKGKSHVLENHFAKSGQCKFDEQNIYVVFTHY